MTGASLDSIRLESFRDNGARQKFAFANRGKYWESLDEIPEPHQFAIMLTASRAGHIHTYAAEAQSTIMSTESAHTPTRMRMWMTVTSGADRHPRHSSQKMK